MELLATSMGIDAVLYLIQLLNAILWRLDSHAAKVPHEFLEPMSSCALESLALAWLATDEYSSTTSVVVTLTNRYASSVNW